MTFPSGITSLQDLDIELGRSFARSWILLFGFLPIDRSDLTFVALEEGRGFVEESPMLAIPLWRHERTIDPTPAGSRIVDRLGFEPRFAAPLVKGLVTALFRNRHRVLRRTFGDAS